MSRSWLYRSVMLGLSFSLGCVGVFLTEYAQSAKPGGAVQPRRSVKQAQLVKSVPAATAVPESATKPVPRPQKAWMDRHNAMNARVKQGNVGLLFIGDSITHGWEKNGKQIWDERYTPRNAVNLGIGGDRTQHVLWRFENGNIGGICPKLAVIMIGTNNSGGNTPEEIAAGIKAIVELLRAKLPETKVLILAIFPRGTSAEDPRRLVNQKTNAIVAKLDDGKMVQYLDIGPKFLIDGKLTKEIMPDLLHLSPAGYKIWADAIEPVVAQACGK